MMRFIVNADDIGLSRSTTNSILRCIDQGFVNSTSILANGIDFEYAVSQLKKRGDVRVAIHLNLHEGIPVSEPDKLGLLVDDNGSLHMSFPKLAIRYILSDKNTRSDLRRQIRRELNSQIEKVIDAFGDGFEVNIDSHQHFHMLPFVFDELISLSKEFKIDYVRIPNEPFAISLNINTVKNWIGLNPFKIALLRSLDAFYGYRKRLSTEGMDYPDFFFGLLSTGDISIESFKASIKGIDLKDGKIIELMTHPGMVSRQDGINFRNRSDRSFYMSKKRACEEEILTSDEFGDFISSVKKDN